MKTILHFLFVAVMVLIMILFCENLAKAETINIDRLANAIYKAEGGSKTKHPYGILAHYKHTTPRQACINTINSAMKRFNKQNKQKDFILFLSKTYCPVGASNDPKGLNKYWVKNVKHYYNKAVLND